MLCVITDSVVPVQRLLQELRTFEKSITVHTVIRNVDFFVRPVTQIPVNWSPELWGELAARISPGFRKLQLDLPAVNFTKCYDACAELMDEKLYSHPLIVLSHRPDPNKPSQALGVSEWGAVGINPSLFVEYFENTEVKMEADFSGGNLFGTLTHAGDHCNTHVMFHLMLREAWSLRVGPPSASTQLARLASCRVLKEDSSNRALFLIRSKLGIPTNESLSCPKGKMQ